MTAVGRTSTMADADQPMGVATWVGFAATGVGMFMAILDVQIVATALPTMQVALGIAPSAICGIAASNHVCAGL